MLGHAFVTKYPFSVPLECGFILRDGRATGLSETKSNVWLLLRRPTRVAGGASSSQVQVARWDPPSDSTTHYFCHTMPFLRPARVWVLSARWCGSGVSWRDVMSYTNDDEHWVHHDPVGRIRTKVFINVSCTLQLGWQPRVNKPQSKQVKRTYFDQIGSAYSSWCNFAETDKG